MSLEDAEAGNGESDTFIKNCFAIRSQVQEIIHFKKFLFSPSACKSKLRRFRRASTLTYRYPLTFPSKYNTHIPPTPVQVSIVRVKF